MISWTEVDVTDPLGWGRGDGVEFSHERIGEVVAFIAGYAWLHHPGGRTVVEIRKRPPDGSPLDRNEWEAMVAEVREAVEYYLARRGEIAPGRLFGTIPPSHAVEAHLNA